MEMKYYSKEHEWVEVKDGEAYVGISVHAAEELGDITFVELPHEGDSCHAGDSLGVVESVKAASDVYAPVSGKIVAVNSQLEDKPEMVNASPEEQAWFCRIAMSDASELDALMDEAAYTAYLNN
ncbi:MAG: glycine cleavage system protein GcvH [Victivallales bacterium]|nr:glycine cleavage system protein GcvH [Victivallales bacterium]